MSAPNVHCKECKNYRPGWGRLCCRCRSAIWRKGGSIAEVSEKEPTAEDVERTIAEQMQCLPLWWEKETQKMRERDERNAQL